MKKCKDPNKIGFARAIGANQNVDGFQWKLLNRRDTLEAANRDVVECS
jgi:hypothetical protein